MSMINLFPESFNIIDLTHTINETTSVWDGSCGFSSELIDDYKNFGFRAQKYTMRSCLGTHLDSPAHCNEGSTDCASIKIENCIVQTYVIDLTSKAHEDYCISVDDIQQFENSYEKIKEGSLVFFSTGWAKRWNDPILFRNVKDDGIPHFPFVSPDVAKLLLDRNVVGIGIDTFSPDPIISDAPVHRLLLGAGKYIIESVANLENMPPINSYAIALPLKISGAVESPIRLIGLVSK
ncbi:MAG: cyclase family protein [Candidatus Babeliales bacterium]|nr:cyclase family protein [Candidatus Babeliales bacterium]